MLLTRQELTTLFSFANTIEELHLELPIFDRNMCWCNGNTRSFRHQSFGIRFSESLAETCISEISLNDTFDQIEKDPESSIMNYVDRSSEYLAAT
jgi:hypothetical protein